MEGPVNFIGMFDRMDESNVAVHQHRCVRVRNRNAGCRNCADACTSGCISFSDGEVVIDNSLCTGCDTCCTVCPTCALEARNPTDAELYRAARSVARAAGGTVVFADADQLAACEGLLRPDTVVAVANLGRIEETLLVRLACEENATDLVLVRSPWDSDATRKGETVAETVCQTANALFDAWDIEAHAHIVPELPESVLAASRADVDAAIAQTAQAAQGTVLCAEGVPCDKTQGTVPCAEGTVPCADNRAARKAELKKHLKVMKDGTLPHFSPERREMLLDALARCGEPRDVVLSTRLMGHVRIDADKCNGCRMCAIFCPTGAIWKFVDEDGTEGVEHASADCVKCRCCEDVCPHDALTLEDSVQASDLLSGNTERTVMVPEAEVRSDPHSAVKAFRKLVGISQIFER